MKVLWHPGTSLHTLVPLERPGNLDGNMRLLRKGPFKCSECSSREVALWLFAKRG